MCLLTQQPSSVSFTDAFLLDVYAKNPDGLGIMYAEAGKLHVYKALPASGQDFIDFYRAHGAHRDCIWHARMKTHGDIDMENCHPYPVTEDIWLAHNGVLTSGNGADLSKSDTWHFIRNVLRPALSGNPDLMQDSQWADFMGGVIGSGNKFGLLRSDGVSCIINRKSGVEFSDSWLSNTYAWTPSRFGYTGAKPAGWIGHYGPYPGDDDEFSLWESGYADWGRQSVKTAAKGVTSVAAKGTTKAAPKATPAGDALIREELLAGALDTAQVKKHVRAAHNQWTRQGTSGLRRWVCDAPEKATRVLAYWYEGLEPIALLGMVRDDPQEAADWIEDLFKSDSISPNWLG